MNQKKYVAYYRVSTEKQGASGLGLEAQRETVEKTIGQGSVVLEFIEIESGKRTSRKKLDEAIEHCKKIGASLIVAKLDRLGRKAKQLWEIKEHLELVACDMPNMDTLVFGIFATFAQSEGEKISERTSAALKAKKARGFKLGTPGNLTAEARQKSIEVRRKKAGEKKRFSKERVTAMEMQRDGKSLRAIARYLNENGFRTRTGKQFQATTIKRLLS